MSYKEQGTTEQFDEVIEECKRIFLTKTRDYGTAWRVYRPISIADQLYIKARRIRNIQETRQQRISDNIESEFRAIVNYAIIGLIQLEINNEEPENLDYAATQAYYESQAVKAADLMGNKNHDYGEAWREMSQEGFVDLILSKILRIKQIIANDGETLVSEGIDSNYFDILNYAVFALILCKEKNYIG